MRSAKLFEQLGVIDKKIKNENNQYSFSREISTVYKKPPTEESKNNNRQKYKNVWYLKRSDKADACREVLAQELSRLIMPASPKTRLVVSNDGKFYVLSKQIPGFVDLHTAQNINKNISFTDGYKGLGEILVLSLVLKEVDLKLGNLAIDENYNIVKFDGDWSFANFRHEFAHKNYSISTKSLDHLTQLPDRFTYNWLFSITRTKPSKHADLNVVHFPETEHLRSEINFCILKLLILPSRLLINMAETYIEDIKEGLALYQDICQSLEELRIAALQNISFQSYLNNDVALKHIDKFKSNLVNFKTTKSNYLLNKVNSENIQLRITEQFNKLQKDCNNVAQAKPNAMLPLPRP